MTVRATTQYLFDESSGELISEIDQNGNTTSLTYTGGVLSKVTGPSGNRSLSFSWSGGNITSVTEYSGSTPEDIASFTYSGSNLTSVTLDGSATGDTKTHTWAFSYSGSLMTSWWSPDNSSAKLAVDATEIAYLASNRVSSVTDPQEPWSCSGGSGTCSPTWSFSWTSWEPNTGSGAVIITDPNEAAGAPNGNTTIDAYADGLLVNQTKGFEQAGSSTPERSATTYSVADPFTWLPSLSIDGDGNETLDTYDSNGNVLAETDPMGNTTSYVYNGFNDVLQETDPTQLPWLSQPCRVRGCHPPPRRPSGGMINTTNLSVTPCQPHNAATVRSVVGRIATCPAGKKAHYLHRKSTCVVFYSSIAPP